MKLYVIVITRKECGTSWLFEDCSGVRIFPSQESAENTPKYREARGGCAGFEYKIGCIGETNPVEDLHPHQQAVLDSLPDKLTITLSPGAGKSGFQMVGRGKRVEK